MSTEDWRDYYDPGHSKEEILREFNLHRGKWWNHYARGRWLSEGGFWRDAAEDFKTAIVKRSEDQRGARSYGMHFWDYFPHRELGIAYYFMGKHEESLAELKRSLGSVESAKAKFYVNKVRRALVASIRDVTSPDITISSHTDGQFVRNRTVRLEGRAKDVDSFVSSVWVGDKRLFIELSAKTIEFSENIRLPLKDNQIVVRAVDLAGNEARRSLKLRLDTSPPVMYFDDVVKPDPAANQRTFHVVGVIHDNVQVKQVFVNGHRLSSVQPGEQVLLDKETDAIQIGAKNVISVKATDIAGNETFARLEVGQAAKKQTRRGNSIFRLAMAGSELTSLLRSRGDWLLAAVSTDKSPPRIRLARDLSKPITVYDETVFIDGAAYDANGIKDISIAGETISPPPNGRGKHAFFNHEVELVLDKERTIGVSVSDTYDNENTKAVSVTRRIAPSLNKTSRYSVAFPALKGVGGDSTLAHISLHRSLGERFNFVARDVSEYESILRELELSATGIVDAKSAVRVGRIKNAEGVIFGKMMETSNSISVEIKLVDTETTEHLAYADVYDEDKSDSNLRWLMDGLAQKLKRRFPIIKGKVVALDKDNLRVDFGAAEGARVGMKLLPYRERRTSAAFREQVMLGVVARIASVAPDSCSAKIVQSDGSFAVKPGDLVIAK